MRTNPRLLPIVLKSILLATLLTLGSIAHSHGQTINFSTAYYAGIPSKFQDSNGLWWNTPLPWAFGKVTNAVDELNQATSVSLSIDGRFSTYFSSGPTSSALGYASEISKNGLLVASDYPTAIISLSGLNTSYTYDLTFYATVGANGNSVQDRRMLIDVLGNSAAAQMALNVYSTANVADEAMITLSNIQPDQEGKITITFSYPSAQTIRGHINAISLTTVIPEPGSVALLTIGAFAMVVGLSRRKK